MYPFSTFVDELSTTVDRKNQHLLYCGEMNLGGRIKKRLTELGWTQAELLDRVPEMSPGTLSATITRDAKKSDFASAIAKALRVRLEWLQSGEGPMQDLAMDVGGLPHPTGDDFAMVPQLDVEASCGNGCYVDHVVVKGGLAFKKSSLRDFGVPESAARIIYAKGGSMWPTIKDGCVVLLNTADREPKEGRVFAICTPDGDLVLKRLVREFHPAMGAQTWLMRSDNPDKTAHPDKILPPDDRTMIAGLAVWNDNRL